MSIVREKKLSALVNKPKKLSGLVQGKKTVVTKPLITNTVEIEYEKEYWIEFPETENDSPSIFSVMFDKIKNKLKKLFR